MKKNIGAFEARRNLGSLLEKVRYRGDKYIVERRGEPMAALVPLELYREWRERRERFFERLRGVQEGSGLSGEEAEAIASEAVARIREER